MDVWNSRPLDVHKWSEFPEVNTFINDLWGKFLIPFPHHGKRKRGVQPKAKPKVQFKVLILDLFVCWAEDADQCIGVSRNRNDYLSVQSRYNRLHISPLIIEYCDQLRELGWIELINGSYHHDDPSKNRRSRIKAAEFLVDRFEEARFGIDAIDSFSEREPLVLKLKSYDLDPLGNETAFNEEIEYEETEHTVRMRTTLSRYNDLLKNTHIDIRDLEIPLIVRQVMTKNGPQEQRIKITQSNKFVRRIFCEGSWESHGRFYGGFWQQLDEDTRARIFMDHHETVEVDFKALHISLLYLCYVKEPFEAGRDPYSLACFDDYPEENSVLRSRVKRLTLQAINAKTRESAFSAFRSQCKAGDPEKRLANIELNDLLEAFLTEHPALRPYVSKGIANELMYLDGQITNYVINRLTQQGIPVLTIHDSYIVKVRDYASLRSAMYLAAASVTGSELHAVQDLLPEIDGGHYEAVVDEYEQSVGHFCISKQYEERYNRWKSWHRFQ